MMRFFLKGNKMKIFTDRVIRLKSRKFEDFLSELRRKNSFNQDILEICVPDGYALDSPSLKKINEERCTGCLLCVDFDDLNSIKENDVPSETHEYTEISEIAKGLFLGEYKPTFFSTKLENHTQKSETTITNPLGALYFWRLSKNPNNTYIRTSPNWELSINTTNILDEREGHLDIVVASERKKIIVMEGKTSVNSLLSSRLREQWARYGNEIISKSSKFGFDAFFTYLIGGEELPLYPISSSAPHHRLRAEFYDFISENDKKFISIEGLRALRLYQLAIDNSFCWEDHLSPLLNDKNFKGLLSNGLVYQDSDFVLKKAPWVDI